MTRYISPTDTAKLVRGVLAQAFPGQKFSVKTSTYAGGAAVRVKWIDGPTEKEVEAITDEFEGASFDSSIDLKSYVESAHNGERVHFGADYVSCTRSYSTDAMSTIMAE